MLIGVVSDTHGHVANTQQAVRVLESLEVELVVHCGDIGSSAIVPLFKPWPTHFVFGNVDDDEHELRASIEQAGQTCHGRFGILELSGRQVGFLHGDDWQCLHQAISSKKFDLICHGHTHRADLHQEETTLVLNPGALYRAQPHSIAVVQLPELEATHVSL